MTSQRKQQPTRLPMWTTLRHSMTTNGTMKNWTNLILNQQRIRKLHKHRVMNKTRRMRILFLQTKVSRCSWFKNKKSHNPSILQYIIYYQLRSDDIEENVSVKMNQAWFPFLSNHNSPQYKMLAGNLEKGVSMKYVVRKCALGKPGVGNVSNQPGHFIMLE